MRLLRPRPIPSVSLARVSGGRGTLLATIGAFAALSAAAGAGLLRGLDAMLLRLAQARPSSELDFLGSALSVPGRAELSSTALAALALWLYAKGSGRLGSRLLAALAATTVVEIATKFVVPQAPIPGDVGRVPDPSLFDFATPYPYPSGHMLRAVLLLGAVYALWPQPARARCPRAVTRGGRGGPRLPRHPLAFGRARGRAARARGSSLGFWEAGCGETW